MRLRPLPALSVALFAALIAASIAAGAAQAQTQSGDPSLQRQHALVRMVRQDCGACHGMKLTGGLGPPLTAQALSDRSVASIVATTLYGRPGIRPAL